MITKIMSLPKKIRLPLAVACAFALIALSGSSAFAVSANISPRNRTICRYNSIGFTISWGGIPNFDITWNNGLGGPDQNFTAYSSGSTTYNTKFNDPGDFDQYLAVTDNNGSGYATTSTTTYVNDSGVGGCPLYPAP